MKWVKELVPYVAIIIAVILIRTFIVTPVRVSGDSMFPTLKNKEILLLKKYDHSFEYYDIVVVNYKGKKIIKRVIGKPNDHIQYIDGKLYVNEKEIIDHFSTITYDFNIEKLGYTKIPEGHYLVLGDNRTISSDSRSIGLIAKKDIIGTTDFRLFPLGQFGKVTIQES